MLCYAMLCYDMLCYAKGLKDIFCNVYCIFETGLPTPNIVGKYKTTSLVLVNQLFVVSVHCLDDLLVANLFFFYIYKYIFKASLSSLQYISLD
jgi:hypothetical protein